MSKLILKDAKTIEKLLLLLGFIKKRQKGSHAFILFTLMQMLEHFKKLVIYNNFCYN